MPKRSQGPRCHYTLQLGENYLAMRVDTRRTNTMPISKQRACNGLEMI
jgi:hypothetical protein